MLKNYSDRPLISLYVQSAQSPKGVSEITTTKIVHWVDNSLFCVPHPFGGSVVSAVRLRPFHQRRNRAASQ
eukprot:COSAG02_NODE_1510_length_12225_cov_3.918770_3_plen_71_part_00